jgi:hypothetical protein
MWFVSVSDAGLGRNGGPAWRQARARRAGGRHAGGAARDAATWAHAVGAEFGDVVARWSRSGTESPWASGDLAVNLRRIKHEQALPGKGDGGHRQHEDCLPGQFGRAGLHDCPQRQPVDRRRQPWRGLPSARGLADGIKWGWSVRHG